MSSFTSFLTGYSFENGSRAIALALLISRVIAR